MLKNPVRILVVTSTFPRWKGDTEPAFVYDLCVRLKEKGFVLDILAPASKGTLAYEIMDGLNIYRYSYFLPGLERLAYAGGILANLRSNRLLYFLVPFFLFFQVCFVYRHLAMKKYDIVHAHWIIPQGLTSIIATKLLGKKAPPVLCTSHGGDLFALNHPLLLVIKNWVLKNVHQLTVVSKYMRDYCKDLSVDMNKVTVCSMGVDLQGLFKPAKNVERKNYRLVFVGRLVEKKGVSILLDAMSILVNKFKQIELIIVGDGPDRLKLEKKVHELEISQHVKFYGSVPQQQLPEIYSSAVIAVVPSVIDEYKDQEGLGLVTIEAMGCSCVVVASSLGAIKEVIMDGSTGLLVTPINPGVLANTITDILNDKEKLTEIAGNARHTVINEYDWETAAMRYQDLLLKMVEETKFSQ